MPWPPQLSDVKADLGLSVDDVQDDVPLTVALDAAVAYVQRVRGASFNFNRVVGSALPLPGSDIELGTVRLAGRWFRRRQSPEGLVQMADMGSVRVPSIDPDIERLLGTGRYSGPVIA